MGRSKHLLIRFCCCAAVVATAFVEDIVAAVPSVELGYYEPLAGVEFRDNTTNAVAKPSLGQPLSMSFDAYGRRFDLALSPNGALLSADLRSRLAARDINVYRGQLQGISDSWARLVVVAGIPRGMIFDGSALYSIEAPGDSLEETARNAPIIFRMADLVVQPDALGCGINDSEGSVSNVYTKLVGELKTLAATGASQNLELAAVADFEFSESFGSGAEAALIDRFNRVDGIFSAELGIQISVTQIDIFTQDTDPFTKSVASELLNELASYRSSTPAQRSRGLSHLFTGRNLDTTTVGIAYVGTLCSNFAGAGLSEGRRGPATDSLIAAHEMGHNFGASHDGDPAGPCENTPETFLMAPSINGNNQFSQCSKDSMAQEIASAQCVTPLADIDVAASFDSANLTVLTGSDFNYGITLDNSGSETATDVTANVQLPAEIDVQSAQPSTGTCTTGAGAVECDLGTIPGNSTRAVSLTLRASAPGDLAVSVSASASIDNNQSNNLAQGTITANPAVDLTMDPIAAAQIDLNGATALRVSVNNDSGLTATGVGVSFTADTGLRIDALESLLGNCSVTGQQADCTGGTLPPDGVVELTLTVTGVSVGQHGVDITASADEAELSGADNTATATVNVQAVATATNSSGGGGGGALLWSLLLLPLPLRHSARTGKRR
jgi:hypothetical protein